MNGWRKKFLGFVIAVQQNKHTIVIEDGAGCSAADGYQYQFRSLLWVLAFIFPRLYIFFFFSYFFLVIYLIWSTFPFGFDRNINIEGSRQTHVTISRFKRKDLFRTYFFFFVVCVCVLKLIVLFACCLIETCGKYCWKKGNNCWIAKEVVVDVVCTVAFLTF